MYNRRKNHIGSKNYDARLYRDVKRINDDSIEIMAEKGKALIKKVVAWCKQKKQEYPKLARTIELLLRLDAFFDFLGTGGFISTNILVRADKEIERALYNRGYVLPSHISAAIQSIIVILRGVIKIKAANAIRDL